MQESSQISPQDIEKLIANGLEYQNAGKIDVAKKYYRKALKASQKTQMLFISLELPIIS